MWVGLGMGSEGLFQRAARFYGVELSRPGAAIGRNTVAAMQAGIVFGHVGLVEGLVERFKEELGEDAKVIGTGGYAELIARETDSIDAVDMNLALKGRRILFEMNRG